MEAVFKRFRATEEPDYVRTRRYDGRKYVDLDEFIKDPEIVRQFNQLAEEARQQRLAKNQQ